MATHLGIVVYAWGALAQDQLLLDCLGPAAGELGRRGSARRFWFDRFDARGPHLFALLTVPPEAREEIAATLAARLAAHLAAHPSTLEIPAERLARLHGETRGKRQCEPDGRTGVAPNNSFEIFHHPERGYPFHLSAGLPDEEEIWNLAADLSLWTISQLAARPGSPAMAAARHWAASVSRELQRAGVRPADYWRYHAGSLIPGLLEGVGREEETSALASLASGLGAASSAFDRAWREMAAEAPVWPGLPRLIHLSVTSTLMPSPPGLCCGRSTMAHGSNSVFPWPSTSRWCSRHGASVTRAPGLRRSSW